MDTKGLDEVVGRIRVFPGVMTRFLAIVILTGTMAGCTITGARPASPALTTQSAQHAAITTKISILTSDDSPAFMQVAEVLRAQSSNPVKIRSLKGGSDAAAGIIRALHADDAKVVVAIGLSAAQAARQVDGRKVVFCQVFDQEAAGLVSPTVRGVSAIPPVEKMFAAWKVLDPGLVRVGMITGPGMARLTGEAKQAAQANGITLVAASAKSDKEMVYVFRRMSRTIQGFWLVPDHRILSADAIRELMSYGMKQGKQLMVFTPDLLQHGGIISVESDYQDIAAQVAGLVGEAARATTFSGPAVRPLTRLRVQVNPMIAREMGLKIPEGYATYR